MQAPPRPNQGRFERSHNALRHDDDTGWSRPSQYWNQYGSHRWNTGGGYEDMRDWGSGARFLTYDQDLPERSHEAPSAGPYYGRGPKGYRRSDERIRDEVCDRLARDPRVDASEIEVEVREGEVTLSGTVEDRRQKRCAEDTIEEVLGVREIHNRIRIQPTSH